MEEKPPEQKQWGKLRSSMNPNKKRRIQKILKFIPVAICAALIILPLASGKEFTVQEVLDYTPEAPLAAALVILLLYALKSMSFVFPIAILQIATGHLFRMPVALLINFLGRAVTLTIPYFAGRFSGSDMVRSLAGKYPRLEEIYSRQERNPLFISFLLRTFVFLPGDAVSMYLGALRIPFRHYLAGGILGTTLGVVLSTILGSSITEPGSPAFLLSASLMTLVALLSAIYYIKTNFPKRS